MVAAGVLLHFVQKGANNLSKKPAKGAKNFFVISALWLFLPCGFLPGFDHVSDCCHGVYEKHPRS